LSGVLTEIRPLLNERQWRLLLLLGAEARAVGRGGIKLVARVVGASVDPVGRGARELEAGIERDGRVRQVGAGRPSVEEADPADDPAQRRERQSARRLLHSAFKSRLHRMAEAAVQKPIKKALDFRMAASREPTGDCTSGLQHLPTVHSNGGSQDF
jgi:hypothetical protein